MSFEDRYFNLKSRLAPFKLKTDFETVKTVSVIDALADRADVIYKGAVPFGGKGVREGYDEESFITKAYGYLEKLEQGEFPLKGMFTEPGIALIDHSFIQHDGKLHVFYIRGYIGYEWRERPCDTIGHAVTEDLVNWTIAPPAVASQYGTLSNFQTWAPGVVKRSDTFYMYYTGVNRNVAQSTFLATSKDLYNWEYYDKNPVYIPGDWCPWDENKWSNCRDHMVMEDDGIYYMYFCTSLKQEDSSVVNATGVAKSTDMYNWEDVNQFNIESNKHAQESPFCIKHNGKYYLFYTGCGRGTCYAVSDNPATDWGDMGLLLGDENHTGDPALVPSCSEVFEFKGQWYISYCTCQPGMEQYLEIKKFQWNDDGTVSVL